MGPGGIIARTQRARYNAASSNSVLEGCALKGCRIRCATRTLLFSSLTLGVSLAAAQSYPSRPDPPAPAVRRRHRRGGAPARVQDVAGARRAGAARAAWAR